MDCNHTYVSYTEDGYQLCSTCDTWFDDKGRVVNLRPPEKRKHGVPRVKKNRSNFRFDQSSTVEETEEKNIIAS